MDDEDVLRLLASEQDAEDQPGDVDADEAAQTDDVGDTSDQDGAGNAPDDQADGADDAGADQGDDAADASAVEPRRSIEDRARAIREENARLAGETAAATARSVAQATRDAAAQAEIERQEREALASMTEDQKATYLLAKETKTLKDRNAQTNALLMSSTDQHKFSRVLAKKPQYEKYEDEVEKRHQATLAQGGFVAREVILAHLIGEKALAAENVGKQKNAASRRVAAARSGNGAAARGDAGVSRTQGRSDTTVVQRAESENWAI